MGVFTALFTCLLSTEAAAQFNPPVAFEDTYPGVGPNIGLTEHTSAYSMQGVNTMIGGGNLVLTGWDDPNPLQPAGVSWRLQTPALFIIAQGIIPYTNVRDLEVGYLDVGGDPEILVAYYLNGTGHMLDVYSFITGTPVLLYTNTLSAMPNYTRISMDCHLTYGTAIAWEDVNGINTVMGLNSGPGPAIQFSPILTLNGTLGQTGVDIAFSHGGPLNVQYAYYNPFSGTITESEFDFWTAMGLPMGSPPVNPTINDINTVGTCRPCGSGTSSNVPIIQKCPYINIDCPGHYMFDNWAYTYTTDNSNISVRLMDMNVSPVASTVIVNNGSVLPTMPLNGNQNMHPFCAYDRNCGPNPAITVAWFTNAMDPITGTTAGYVGLRMDQSGTTLLSPPDYMTVANNPAWASMTPVLSLSKQDDMFPYLYTIFPEYDPTVPGFRMENKYPFFCSNSFKGTPDAQEEHSYYCNDNERIAEYRRLNSLSAVNVFPNPFKTTFKLSIPSDCLKDNATILLTDVLGTVVGEYSGPSIEANAYLDTKTKSLAAGSYFLNVSIEGKVKETLKITKAE